MSERAFRRNELREKEMQTRGQTAGLPLFDGATVKDQTLRGAVLPGRGKSIEVLTPVQRAALDALREKMSEQNLHVLTLFEGGEALNIHDVVARSGYPINVASRVLNTLRVTLELIIAVGSWPGPNGVDINHYHINVRGIEKIAQAEARI